MQIPTHQKILAWLDDSARNYFAGIAMLEQQHGDSFLIRMLKRGPDKYNWQKLTEHLQAEAALLAELDKQKDAELPPELKVKQANSGDLMSERRVIKGELRTLWLNDKHDEEHFKKQAYRILDITDTLDGAYGDISFYKKHGVMPEAEEALPPAQLYNLRTYLTKYQKALAKGKTLKGRDLSIEKRNEYEEKVQQLRAQIAGIEQENRNENTTVSID